MAPLLSHSSGNSSDGNSALYDADSSTSRPDPHHSKRQSLLNPGKHIMPMSSRAPNPLFPTALALHNDDGYNSQAPSALHLSHDRI